MGLKDQLEWAKSEWGILSQGDNMSPREAVRWFSQWVPFGARTIGYATISCTLGPLTKDHGASLWAMKAWCRSSLDAVAVNAEVEGGHLVPAGGLMYASNHQSLMDILVLGAVLPGDLKWAAKRSVMQIPFLGWHLTLSGHVPVERKAGKRGAVKAIKRFEEVMREGKQLLIFPEGTRTTDGEVKAFKNGGFYAAVRADRPVVPVALDGTHQLMKKHAPDTGEAGKSSRRRRQVLIAIGEPLHPLREGAEKDRVADLRERTRAAVVEMHARLRLELADG
jgi:1-acyl-sn-glycerol-3-phosphate acyltransferase